jgi:hypothetical protein
MLRYAVLGWDGMGCQWAKQEMGQTGARVTTLAADISECMLAPVLILHYGPQDKSARGE